ncbi:hypothetical protein [Roseococcus pinisoli]|uniref:Uncharacterized protein n=1 Tax=Roseococcus pinisoli TaxID=2835040 RepID=A0ABS5QGS7_9PROT|nr:hypothetical protein [Roseococcus pinisoli]MBS7812747.1 hypothetical protein [Roseococcus pinisoli]
MKRRHLLSALPASFAAAGTARAQQHWLVGDWVGDLLGSRDADPRRRLTVTSVDVAGGTARGSWGRNETPIQISGDTVRLTTGGNSPVVLRYTAPDRLEGTVSQSNSGSRPPFTIVMRRR